MCKSVCVCMCGCVCVNVCICVCTCVVCDTENYLIHSGLKRGFFSLSINIQCETRYTFRCRLSLSSPCRSPPMFLPTPNVSARRFRSRCFLSRIHCTCFLTLSRCLFRSPFALPPFLSFAPVLSLFLSRSFAHAGNTLSRRIRYSHFLRSSVARSDLPLPARSERVQIRANWHDRHHPDRTPRIKSERTSRMANARRDASVSRRTRRTNSEEKRPRRGGSRRLCGADRETATREGQAGSHKSRWRLRKTLEEDRPTQRRGACARAAPSLSRSSRDAVTKILDLGQNRCILQTAQTDSIICTSNRYTENPCPFLFCPGLGVCCLFLSLLPATMSTRRRPDLALPRRISSFVVERETVLALTGRHSA